MKKIISFLLVLTIFISGSFIFSSSLDKFLFFWLLVSAALVFTTSRLNKMAYAIALVLIVISSVLYFLDPMKVRLAHYIYKPATWSFYFMLLGVIGDFYHDLRGTPHDLIGRSKSL